MKSIKTQIKEANKKLQRELNSFPYQEEPPLILINDEIRFYEPIVIHDEFQGFSIRPDISDTQSDHCVLGEVSIKSVQFIHGHGV